MAVEIAKPYLDPRADKLLAALPAPRKALFLDRDGVINVDRGYVHKPEDTEWVPGIFELCANAQQAGYLLVVVTNQAGIARGYYTEATFLDFTRWMHEQFAVRCVPLTATYYCPHHPDAGLGELRISCECRKPRPGMILASAQQLDLRLSNSMLIGDTSSDMQAAASAGLGASFLIETALADQQRILRYL